jgi:hypothetical protein
MRKASLTMSRELLESLLKAGATYRAECVTGIPEGAVLIGAGLDDLGDIRLTFQHESFAEAEEGQFPKTELVPMFRTAGDETNFDEVLTALRRAYAALTGIDFPRRAFRSDSEPHLAAEVALATEAARTAIAHASGLLPVPQELPSTTVSGGSR